MKLVKNWRMFYKYYSNIFHTVQLASIATWTQLPQEWKSVVPGSVLLAVCGVVWVSGVIGSVVSQSPQEDSNVGS